jgi:hypothetical protein
MLIWKHRFAFVFAFAGAIGTASVTACSKDEPSSTTAPGANAPTTTPASTTAQPAATNPSPSSNAMGPDMNAHDANHPMGPGMMGKEHMQHMNDGGAPGPGMGHP